MTINDDRSIFIDSSAWISYTIEPDSNHAKAVKIFETAISDARIIISTFILNETISKLRKVLDQDRANLFYLRIKSLEKTKKIKVYNVVRADLEKSVVLLNRYPTPNTFSLTDATNIILCQKHRIKTLFSFDSDFKKLRLSNLQIIP